MSLDRSLWPECPHEDSENWCFSDDGVWRNISGLKDHQFQPGNTLGGRTEGSKNKKTFREDLVASGKMTPAEYLVSVMHDERENSSRRMKAAEKLLLITEPNLSAISVEASGSIEPMVMNVVLTKAKELMDVSKETEEDLDGSPEDDRKDS